MTTNEYKCFKLTLLYCVIYIISIHVGPCYYDVYSCKILLLINPRRACARVTVLVLSVCVFSLFWHLAQSGVQTAVSATSARYGHEI